MRESKSFSLPFDIELEIVDGVANIESELGRALPHIWMTLGPQERLVSSKVSSISSCP
jgi:hypothetical protein